MEFQKIFYSVFWISTISVIWFYTDTVLHYSRLFKLWVNIRLEYLAYIALYPNKFFPDFLSEKMSCSKWSIIVFLTKLFSCPACSTAWLSVIAGIACAEPIIIGPVYILSLLVIYQIRNLI